MCFFKKKPSRVKDMIIEDQEVISQCSSMLATLAARAEDINIDVHNKLNSLRDSIEYATPSREEDVYKLDQKLLAKIGDLKIAFTKAANNEDLTSISQQISAVKDMIIERNEEAKRFRQNQARAR